MSTTATAPVADVVVRGVVRNGVVELPPGAFPEGAEVGVTAARAAPPKPEPAHNFRDADGNLLDLTPEEVEELEVHLHSVARVAHMMDELEASAVVDEKGAGHAAG